MMTVEVLDDMKAAFVDVEMDVPGLEIGGAGLPDLRLRIEALRLLPRGKADASAVFREMISPSSSKWLSRSPNSSSAPYLKALWLSRMNCSRSSAVSLVRVMSAIFDLS